MVCVGERVQVGAVSCIASSAFVRWRGSGHDANNKDDKGEVGLLKLSAKVFDFDVFGFD